ncbi:beta-1,3-galactosyl-O-glycosyl-glycoprotein beta-1,6-N-acetylglucosaminyltransferase [Patella vulgata]|uniref:beta-1,3-galactosyl-O-glycosyl-glycoprotein beta-1,6-N-acetylglucosaminyltransferase n=1 Tax=Patella vulgata TaxID=6465 RepID=UPI00217F723E|nr:beta-1,3-galactosyl-O-glycosyl-glycoprotein beta-1,6-N-acetylglucosaminyltransferase [Patella vulgata]
MCKLNKITKNCKLFRQINGYEDKVITKLEEDFPIAFGIRLHKSAEPIEQILRIIYRPHNFYCIHVDNGSDIRVFNSLKSVARCFDNVIILSQIRTIYSSIRLVEADLLCMKEAMKSTIQWKYFLNMAGQELPLKTNLEIVQICQILQGRNDIESEPANDVLMNRMMYEYNFTKYRLKKTDIRKKPFAPRSFFRKGSAYGTFSREFVGFVLSSDIAKDLMEFLKNVWAPEETFFNTLNSVEGAPGGYNISVKHGTFDFISREEIWKWDPVVCHGTFYKDVCIFNNRDLPWLVKQPEIIANKMEGGYDQVVIDCIEEYLYNKSLQADIFALNKTHYKQYPHTKDLYKTN